MKKGDEVVNGYFFSKGEVFVLFTLVLCLGVAVTLLVDDYVRPQPGLLVVDEERVLYDLEGVNEVTRINVNVVMRQLMKRGLRNFFGEPISSPHTKIAYITIKTVDFGGGG